MNGLGLCAHTRARLGVEQLVVALVDADHLGRHRAVEVDLPARQVPFVPVQREPVQQFLAAADRERRDQHVAAVAPGIVEDAAELADGVGALAVVAVAVGRFHQHQVGARRSAPGRAGSACPSGRDRRRTPASCRRPTARRRWNPGCGRPRGTRSRRRAGSSCGCRTAAARTCAIAALTSSRVYSGSSFAARPSRAVAVGALGLAFGDRGRVQQHDRHQVGGRRLRVDRAAEAALDQQRHAADVVDVGVADHQRIERGGFERERLGVAVLGLGAALDQPAVEQQPLAGGLDLVQRSGDLARRSVEMHAHASLPRRSTVNARNVARGRRRTRGHRLHTALAAWPATRARGRGMTFDTRRRAPLRV